MKMAYAFAALGAAALLYGCGGGAPSEASAHKKDAPASLKQPDGASLLPLAQDDEWTYEVKESVQGNGAPAGSSMELTFKVTKVEQVNGGTRATMDVMTGKNLVNKLVWEMNSQGLYQVAAGMKLVEFHPMQPALLFPMSKNTEFPWQGTGLMGVGDKAGSGKFTNVVIGPELVDTAGKGQQWAICTETEGTFSAKVKDKTGVERDAPGETHTYTWWTPKVGIVRISTKTGVRGIGVATQLFRIKSSVVK